MDRDGFVIITEELAAYHVSLVDHEFWQLNEITPNGKKEIGKIVSIGPINSKFEQTKDQVHDSLARQNPAGLTIYYVGIDEDPKKDIWNNTRRIKLCCLLPHGKFDKIRKAA